MTVKRIKGKIHPERKMLVKKEPVHPIVSLQDEINRVFDDFQGGVSLLPSKWMMDKTFMPKVNVSESEKDIAITAELPGMTEKDVDVSLSRGVLTIKGEKKAEKEEKNKNYYYMERSSGSFHREIPLPDGSDSKHAEATFKNGLLKVHIPKVPEVKTAKKNIPVKVE